MEGLNKLSVIVPAFDEVKSLTQLLPMLIDYCDQKQWNLILVNDGSGDGTKELFLQIPPSDKIAVVHHKLNRGYGAAIKSGILACCTEFAITIDADGQHQLEDIDKLYALITARDADMVVGSRKNGKTGSYYRGVGKFIIRNLAKILMTVPIHDLNSGMKIYRTDLAQHYIHLAPDTMAFSDIIALIFINNRHLVLETPITVNERKHGKSKIGIEVAFHTLMEIINIVILFSPMKIFLPLSLISFLVAGFWGFPLLIQGHGVSTGSLLGAITGLLMLMLGLIAEQLSLIRRNQHKR
ncbi:MAG: glycosyltransferase family 2 protein [Bacteroidota bacterium]